MSSSVTGLKGWGIFVLAASPMLAACHWTANNVTPAGASQSSIQAGYGSAFAVQLSGLSDQARYVNGSTSLPIQYPNSQAITPLGMNAINVCGFALDQSSNAVPFVWNIATQRTTSLLPSGNTFGQATGVWGPYICGLYGTTTGSRAVVWFGSLNSRRDISPVGTAWNGATCIQGTMIGGYTGYYNGNQLHAALWNGFNNTPVDLDAGFGSQVNALDQGLEGGSYSPSAGANTVPCIWRGSAGSVVNLLSPTFVSGGVTYTEGQVNGMAAGYQTGFVGDDSGHHETAVVWRGSASSAVDLGQYLPSGLGNCEADSMSADSTNLYVYGRAFDSNGNSQVIQWILPKWEFTYLPLGGHTNGNGGQVVGQYVGGSAFWDLANLAAGPSDYVGLQDNWYVYGQTRNDKSTFIWGPHTTTIPSSIQVVCIGSHGDGHVMEVASDQDNFCWGIFTDNLQNEVFLTPPGSLQFPATGTPAACDNGVVVGYYSIGYTDYAMFWDSSGTAQSFTSDPSSAKCIQGNFVGGYRDDGTRLRATLWTLSPLTQVDLHPLGADFSSVDGITGDIQAGYASFGGKVHAMVWQGSAGSALDLQTVAPAGTQQSAINSISYYHGLVASGWVLNSAGTRVPAIWTSNF